MDIFGSSRSPPPTPSSGDRGGVSSWFQGSKPPAAVDPFAADNDALESFASISKSTVRQTPSSDYDFTGSSGNNQGDAMDDPFGAPAPSAYNKGTITKKKSIDGTESSRDRSESEALIDRFKLMYDIPPGDGADGSSHEKANRRDSLNSNDKDNFWSQGDDSRTSGKLHIRSIHSTSLIAVSLFLLNYSYITSFYFAAYSRSTPPHPIFYVITFLTHLFLYSLTFL